jgi:hypothetical protein
MVFSKTEHEHTVLLHVWPSFGKNFQIEAGICNPKYFRASGASESLDLEIRFKIQSLL